MHAAEEAAADDHMLTHWRPDPRDVRKGKSAGMMDLAYEHPKVHSSLFRSAYRKNRQVPLQRPIREAQRSAKEWDAATQPSMILLANPQAQTRYPIEPHAKPEGALHPMQFGRL